MKPAFKRAGFLFYYMSSEKNNWYETWFNTPYYHTLYCNRNTNEAEDFIKNVITFLKPEANSKFWDLACGKGRHSLTLSEMGFSVTGTDLSEENIKYASKFENEHLHFYRLDMRSPFRINYFDYVFNLFTSFGYFEKKSDDLKVFRSVYNSLKPGGKFLFDYINGKKALTKLIKEEEKSINGIHFRIQREFNNGRVNKRIEVTDGDQKMTYNESVKLFTPEELKSYAQVAGFNFIRVFGNYQLNDFDENTSDRLILLFEKR